MRVELSGMSLSSYYSLPNNERSAIDQFIRKLQQSHGFPSGQDSYTEFNGYRVYRVGRNLRAMAKVVDDQTGFGQILHIVQIQYGNF